MADSKLVELSIYDARREQKRRAAQETELNRQEQAREAIKARREQKRSIYFAGLKERRAAQEAELNRQEQPKYILVRLNQDQDSDLDSLDAEAAKKIDEAKETVKKSENLAAKSCSQIDELRKVEGYIADCKVHIERSIKMIAQGKAELKENNEDLARLIMKKEEIEKRHADNEMLNEEYERIVALEAELAASRAKLAALQAKNHEAHDY